MCIQEGHSVLLIRPLHNNTYLLYWTWQVCSRLYTFLLQKVKVCCIILKLLQPGRWSVFQVLNFLVCIRMSWVCKLEHFQAIGDLISYSLVVCTTIELLLRWWLASLAVQSAEINTTVHKKHLRLPFISHAKHVGFIFQSKNMVRNC